MILHHYEPSPFSAKIRLMLDYCHMPWQSLLSPAVPPRPNVDPLAGGYRKIPVAQIGADIFCDSRMIASEIAALSERPELDPFSMDEDGIELMRYAEFDAFLAAFGSATFSQTLQRLISHFGVWGAFRFLRDRAAFSKNSTLSIPPRDQAIGIYQRFLDDLDNRLKRTEFLGGDLPSAVDFSCWLPLYGPMVRNGSVLFTGGEHVQRWCKTLSAYDLSVRREVTQKQALDAAKAEPRVLPLSNESNLLGRKVEVGPNDYAKDKMTGVLVALTDTAVIVARESKELGTLHVHFPVQGFDIKAIDG